MNTLPTELLYQILSHIPKSSLPSVRLLNHTFEAIAFPLLFKNLLNWLDYKTSHAAITALAHDVYNRPSIMWSPCASEPDGPVEAVWLGIIWRLQMGKHSPELERGIGMLGGEVQVLTSENYARLSRREEMCENRLRLAQNRYLMHRSYFEGAVRGEISEELVEGSLVWEENEL
ncbi:uncharacterized protein RSE6_05223 [Rhynchosporium secalis]|uniref:F-box domain-containing protein n=1 Tax=Rhynchosporium secalis TaxID=38038 RepID=A0A1E1M784_RHYSE|nr:uncharacterized protein RSE6_05223 [Rhynchosporium secalis]